MSKKPTKSYSQYAELVKTYSEFAIAYHRAGVTARKRFDLQERVNVLTAPKKKPSK